VEIIELLAQRLEHRLAVGWQDGLYEADSHRWSADDREL
jgi:hypothetical protein